MSLAKAILQAQQAKPIGRIESLSKDLGLNKLVKRSKTGRKINRGLRSVAKIGKALGFGVQGGVFIPFESVPIRKTKRRPGRPRKRRVRL